jgi:hypothetical protein
MDHSVATLQTTAFSLPSHFPPRILEQVLFTASCFEEGKAPSPFLN